MGRESIEEGFFVSFQCLNHFSILLGLCIERLIQLRHAWQFFVRISFFLFSHYLCISIQAISIIW